MKKINKYIFVVLALLSGLLIVTTTIAVASLLLYNFIIGLVN